MPRACTVCQSGHRAAVDRALNTCTALAVLARRFRVSPDALLRHKKHATQCTDVLPAAAPTGIDSLAVELDNIASDLARLQADCENRDDVRAAVQVLRERLGLLRTRAELENTIKGSPGAKVNVAFFHGALPPGQTVTGYLECVYASLEKKLLSPDTGTAAYRQYQLALAECGYAAHQIDELLTLFGYRLPSKGVPYAPVGLPAG